MGAYLNVELHVEGLSISNLVLLNQVEEDIFADRAVFEDRLSSVNTAGSIHRGHALSRRSLHH